MHDITSDIGAERSDPHELAQWIWNYFGGQLSSSEREIVISKDSLEIVRAEFSKCGRLKTLRVAEANSQKVAEIRDAIYSDLVANAKPRVFTEILFSSSPVDGSFKFEDKLLIRPVPPDAPRPDSPSFGEQPFLLEFAVSESRNVFVTGIRVARRVREFGVLLAALLDAVIEVHKRVARLYWVNVPLSGPGEMPKLESRCLPAGYICPGIRSPSNDFSSVQDRPKIEQVTTQEYYTRWGQLAGRSLEIPDSLDKLLSAFFSLSLKDRQKFLRAAYWFSQAKAAYLDSKSYQYVALVMAIETLANESVLGEKCTKCGRDLENGPTKAFQRFLDRYTPGFENEKALKRGLYTIRCDLSHGSRLLLEDMDSPLMSLAPMTVEEANRREVMYKIVRIALVNWLSSRGGR